MCICVFIFCLWCVLWWFHLDFIVVLWWLYGFCWFYGAFVGKPHPRLFAVGQSAVGQTLTSRGRNGRVPLLLFLGFLPKKLLGFCGHPCFLVSLCEKISCGELNKKHVQNLCDLMNGSAVEPLTFS